MDEQKKIKKSVRIKQEKEARKEWLKENEGSQGAIKTLLKNVPTSPRKMRLIADMIRGKRVYEALNILKFDSKVGSSYLETFLMSAIDIWGQKNQDFRPEDEDLYIKEIFVDSGKMLKRLRTAPQGRGHRIRKRSNHVTIVIDNWNDTAIIEKEIQDTIEKVAETEEN